MENLEIIQDEGQEKGQELDQEINQETDPEIEVMIVIRWVSADIVKEIFSMILDSNIILLHLDKDPEKETGKDKETDFMRKIDLDKVQYQDLETNIVIMISEKDLEAEIEIMKDI